MPLILLEMLAALVTMVPSCLVFSSLLSDCSALTSFLGVPSSLHLVSAVVVRGFGLPFSCLPPEKLSLPGSSVTGFRAFNYGVFSP